MYTNLSLETKSTCINLSKDYGIYYMNHSKEVYTVNTTTNDPGLLKFIVDIYPSPLAQGISTAKFL